MKLITDKKLRREIAYKGKKYVENNFSWGKITDQYLYFYRQILGK
tara:strand:+ start:425 stop:559 length:135 start_codon:yes stop_codon:yes gene_type:complete